MDFIKFNKIPRLSRDIVISEKLDGTNAQIVIMYIPKFRHTNEESLEAIDIHKYMLSYWYGVDGSMWGIFAGSRNRWLDCSKEGDNHGFAKWMLANVEELKKLGEGRHFGEWYGNGINRSYELDEKRFALFNVGRWINYYECYADNYEGKKLVNCPKCCEVVPVLYEGLFDTKKIEEVLEKLRIDGSSAVPGYLNPEGIVIRHQASGQLFKKTILNDSKPKGR